MANDVTNRDPILYTTEDGAAAIKIRIADGTVWLTQLELGEALQTRPRQMRGVVPNIW